MNHIVDALTWRYATKKFDSTKKLSSTQYQELQEILRLTPSSFGLQPWKFVLVQNQDTKNSLLEHSWGQAQVVDCDILIVMCRVAHLDASLVENYIVNMAETRHIPAESLDGYKNMMLGFVGNTPEEAKKTWADKQIYIALGNAMTALADMRIDACPMEGFIAEKYDQILGLTELGLSSVVVLPVGFRSSEDEVRTKVRYEKEEIILEI